MSVKIITFGCRLNTYESEVIKNFLKDQIPKDLNIILFNSCAVTAEAERQLRQAIRKTRKENPSAKIGLIGCVAQLNKELYKKMDEIDFIFGNKDKMELANYLKCNFAKNNEKSIVVSDIKQLKELSPHLISDFEEKSRVFLQIQSGCDNECTFCITRIARGKSISVEPDHIIKQVKEFVKNGYNEIVLTGVNIVDYGKRLKKKINLGKLIKKIFKETRVPRLRLSSLDVAAIDKDLMDLIKNEPRLMPHFHLSLQSGDNTILKRMRRRHTREDVIKFCEKVKKYRSNVTFGADLIAGFPTETEKMHKNTINLVKKINIVFGHIFPYSARPETPAAKMPPIDKKIRKRRAKELRDLTNKQLEKFKTNQIGKKIGVLIESKNIGRTDNYLSLKLKGDFSDKIGQIVEIEYK